MCIQGPVNRVTFRGRSAWRRWRIDVDARRENLVRLEGMIFRNDAGYADVARAHAEPAVSQSASTRLYHNGVGLYGFVGRQAETFIRKQYIARARPSRVVKARQVYGRILLYGIGVVGVCPRYRRYADLYAAAADSAVIQEVYIDETSPHIDDLREAYPFVDVVTISVGGIDANGT